MHPRDVPACCFRVSLPGLRPRRPREEACLDPNCAKGEFLHGRILLVYDRRIHGRRSDRGATNTLCDSRQPVRASWWCGTGLATMHPRRCCTRAASSCVTGRPAASGMRRRRFASPLSAMAHFKVDLPTTLTPGIWDRWGGWFSSLPPPSRNPRWPSSTGRARTSSSFRLSNRPPHKRRPRTHSMGFAASVDGLCAAPVAGRRTARSEVG